MNNIDTKTRKKIWTETIIKSLNLSYEDRRYESTYRYLQFKNDGQNKKHRKCFMWPEINSDTKQPYFSENKDSWISLAIYYKRLNKKGAIAAINCNFIQIPLELDTSEKTPPHNKDHTSLTQYKYTQILKQCKKFNIPQPLIIYTADSLQLIWLWKDYMVKKEYVTDRYGYIFNLDWENMQKKLYSIFSELGAMKRKLAPTTMFRIPGSINTVKRLKTKDRIVRVIHKGEVLDSYADMQYALGLITQKPEHKPKPQPTPQEMWEAAKKIPDSYTARFADDWEKEILRIHPSSDNLVCIFRKKNSYPHIQTNWVKASDLKKYLMQLTSLTDIRHEDIYISQLEFNAPKRTIDHVCSIGVNFLDLDFKELKKNNPNLSMNFSPKTWVRLITEKVKTIGGVMPDVIVFSGGGVHIKWIYKSHVDISNLPTWQAFQKLLALMFRSLGADYAALDASRILRLVGSLNQKNEDHISDHHVRVISSSQRESLTFDELIEQWLNAVPPDKDMPEFNQLKADILLKQKKINVSDDILANHIALHMENFDLKIDETDIADLRKSVLRIHPICNNTWVHLKFPDGCSCFVQTYELEEYLTKAFYPAAEVRISIAEYFDQKFTLQEIPCNYVILNKCPGENVKAKIDNIMKHCKEYRDVGIPLPNQIIREGNTYIVLWIHESLPGYAISRWEVTQEFLCRHFEEWGAMSNPEFLTPNFHLPVPDFYYEDTGVFIEFDDKENSYLFHDLATAVLHFTQEEVENYRQRKLDEKAEQAAYFRQFRASLNADDTLGLQKKRNKFSYTAEKRFNDIMTLLEMRKNRQGEISSGHRELCVFHAAISAIQAGIVPRTKQGITSLLEKLIDFCGKQFKSECSTKTFGTLIRKFLAGDKITYRLKNSTIVKVLGITEDEQKKLTVLRTTPREQKKREPRESWLAKHTTERDQPWRVLRISRATWFRMKKLEAMYPDLYKKIAS